MWVLRLPDSGKENHCVSGQEHVFLRLGGVDGTQAKARRQPDHWPLFCLLQGQSIGNFVWRKAEGKGKLAHLLTTQSLIQDVIIAAARNEEKGSLSESKKCIKRRESFEKPP